MTLVLAACPVGLRGDLTKWLVEISPGVFVGSPSARVRELLWERTTELCRDGRAVLVYSSPNEQGLEYRTHNHNWSATDFDGITLMRRTPEASTGDRRTGWSAARGISRSRRPW